MPQQLLPDAPPHAEVDISSDEQAISALQEVALDNDIWPDHETDRSAMLLAAVIKFLQQR